MTLLFLEASALRPNLFWYIVYVRIVYWWVYCLEKVDIIIVKYHSHHTPPGLTIFTLNLTLKIDKNMKRFSKHIHVRTDIIYKHRWLSQIAQHN